LETTHVGRVTVDRVVEERPSISAIERACEREPTIFRHPNQRRRSVTRSGRSGKWLTTEVMSSACGWTRMGARANGTERHQNRAFTRPGRAIPRERHPTPPVATRSKRTKGASCPQAARQNRDPYESLSSGRPARPAFAKRQTEIERPRCLPPRLSSRTAASINETSEPRNACPPISPERHCWT
jgi:hypothetical protein